MLRAITGRAAPCGKGSRHQEAGQLPKTRTPALLFTIGLMAALLASAGIAWAENIYVTKAGSPDPDGSAVKPYHVVESATSQARLSPGSTILIQPGKYYETFTIDAPCTLESAGGDVVLGADDNGAATTLDIITLNTHLAGTAPVMPSYYDRLRANDIAQQLVQMAPNKPDVVAFQEIWDEDLFFGGGDNGVGQNNEGLCQAAGYPYGRHGSAKWDWGDWDNVLNSGLALMSNYVLTDFEQVQWDSPLEGWDQFAAKGYIRATIVKEGFSIGLFTLHTQADHNWDNVQTRLQELAQLASAIKDYRAKHPDHVVFVTGDFNIKGEVCQWYYVPSSTGMAIPTWYCEYYDSLIAALRSAGGKDADRNSPGFIVDPNCEEQWTSHPANLLAWHFGEPENARLDYIFYLPDLQGAVEVLPKTTDVLPFRGTNYPVESAPGFTNDSSDHYSVHAKFTLIRK